MQYRIHQPPILSLEPLTQARGGRATVGTGTAKDVMGAMYDAQTPEEKAKSPKRRKKRKKKKQQQQVQVATAGPEAETVAS